jgi:hypothetical protein
MGMPEYRQVIEAYCEKAGIADVDAVLLHGAIKVRGLPVWLQYFEPADLCRVVLDLGAPDAGIPPQVWRAMLESNCSNRSNSLPFLAINPLDGHAILILHLAISRILQEDDFPEWLDEHLAPAIEAWQRAFAGLESVADTGQFKFGSGFA